MDHWMAASPDKAEDRSRKASDFGNNFGVGGHAC